MRAATGKTFGLIFIISLILLAGLRLTPLVVAPLGIFSGISQTFRSSVHGLGRLNFEPFFGGALVLFWIAVLIWVYRDAERRKMNGVLWGLLVFIGNLVGLIIYLIVRNESRPTTRASTPAYAVGPGNAPVPAGAGGPGNAPVPAPCGPPVCPKCGKPADAKHAFCPFCGESLQSVCPKCGNAVEQDWNACAHCGEKIRL
jgi:hypothetical protein